MRSLSHLLSHCFKPLVVCAAIAVTPASASSQATTTIQIPAGTVSESRGQVFLNGDEVHRNDHATLFDFGKAGVLIESRHGGNACPNSYMILHPDTGALREIAPESDRSTVFGECHRLERVLPDLGLVVMKPQSGNEQARLFAWNGYRMSLTILPRALEGARMPGGGSDVERWIGRYMHEFTQDPGEQQRLKQVLSDNELAEFNLVSDAGSPIERRGDWIVGSACWPALCTGRWVVLALRISDGAPFVVMADGTRAMPEGETLPALLQQVNALGQLP